jgi:hypothetical protein
MIKYLIFLFLSSCFGPTLVNIGGLKITASDVITAPHKIEKFKDKEINGHK